MNLNSQILWKILKKGILRRDLYFKKLKKSFDNPIIKVITWTRRVGKSYILMDIINFMDKQWKSNIFYVNKEYIEFDFLKNYKDLNKYFLEIFPNIEKINVKDDRVYLFLDEIQEITWWEKFVNNLLSQYWNVDIYVTGSNSKLLSSKLATLLTWRYIQFQIFPLSFFEYSEFSEKPKNKNTFLDYVTYGWLPWYHFFKEFDEDIVKKYIESVLNSIFIKDIIKFHNIKDKFIFDKLYIFLSNILWSITSTRNIQNQFEQQWIKSSVDTLLKYIDYWAEAFLVYYVPRYNVKWKKLLQYKDKIYFWDLWFVNILNPHWLENINWLLENYVYLTLKQKWYTVYIWELQDKEIDFVATKNNETIYIQVAYIIPEDNVYQREFWNLKLIKDNWRKIVISMDDIHIKDKDGIEHIQAWELENRI